MKKEKIKKSARALAVFTMTVFAAGTALAGGWNNDCPYKDGQGYRDGRGKGHHCNEKARLGYLKTELGLSDTQIEQIKKINDEFRDKFSANRGNHDKLMGLRDQRHNAIKAVLTADQGKKFDELRDKRSERHNRHDGRKHRNRDR